jgi:dihydroceramide fatty acyl 2-hydroxylase
MVAGYLTWTLSEYWVHRAVFHFQPRGPRRESFVWTIHGMHHAYPNDPRRVVTAPVASIPIGAGAAVLFWWAMPGLLWLPFAAGWGGGYLAYDLLHAYLHVGRPRTALLRWLRARHLRHHFADSRGDFGVSAPYWDRAVLGLGFWHLVARPSSAPAREREGDTGTATEVNEEPTGIARVGHPPVAEQCSRG